MTTATLAMVTPPFEEPITLGQFKTRAKIYTSADDGDISNFILPAARQAVEDELRRAIITQTWLLKLDNFPPINPRYERNGYPSILIPKPPFQSIVSFTYVDTAGVTQTLSQAGAGGTMPQGVFYGYQLDPGSETQPARLTPPWAIPWPPARRIPGAVQIEFICGYGPTNTSPQTWPIPGGIPPVFLQAIFLQANHMYFNREAVVAGPNGGVELTRGVKALLGPYVNHIA